MRVHEKLSLNLPKGWARLQQLKNSEWFVHDLEEQLRSAVVEMATQLY